MRDSKRSKMEILKAAEEEFLEKGFSGARVDAIAERSGVSKVLMYRYFGNKRKMFARVIEARMDEFERGRMSAPSFTTREALVEWVTKTIQGHFRYLARHPELVRLMALECLDNTMNLDRLRARRRAGMSVMREAIEEGQRKGIVRGDTDAAQLVYTLASGNFFYFIHKDVTSDLLNADQNSKDMLTARSAHVSMLLDALL